MTIAEQIKQAYPELADEMFSNGQIQLQNDSDGKGDYIKEWDIDLPIPDGLVVGKPL